MDTVHHSLLGRQRDPIVQSREGRIRLSKQRAGRSVDAVEFVCKAVVLVATVALVGTDACEAMTRIFARSSREWVGFQAQHLPSVVRVDGRWNELRAVPLIG